MATNYVLTRPGFCGYMTTASSYTVATNASANSSSTGGWASLGSVREVNLELKGESLEATSTVYNDAVVQTALSGYGATLTIQCEEITSSTMLLAMNINASGYNDASATTQVDYALTTGPWYIDGSGVWLVATKCHNIPTATRRIGKEQEILELKFDVLVDTSASSGKKFIRFTNQT